MSESTSSEANLQAEPRRRRRRAGGLVPPEVLPGPAPPATQEHPSPPRRGGHGQWYSSWGLSPAFRIYVFLGSILALIAFLLYSESLIRQAKEQERNRVYLFARLHAFAVSPLASGEQAAFIFQEVINNPNSDFPIIITNHRGEITDWRGADLPAPGDLGPEARQQLQVAMEVMDAANPPVAFVYHSEAVGYCYWDEDRFIITDNAEELEKRVLVEWVGRDLPARGIPAGRPGSRCWTRPAASKRRGGGEPSGCPLSPSATFTTGLPVSWSPTGRGWRGPGQAANCRP